MLRGIADFVAVLALCGLGIWSLLAMVDEIDRMRAERDNQDIAERAVLESEPATPSEYRGGEGERLNAAVTGHDRTHDNEAPNPCPR